MPHSEILGSKVAPTSPRLIAGCHVLHRLSTPRHPPDALCILDTLDCPCAGTNPPIPHRNQQAAPTHERSALSSSLPDKRSQARRLVNRSTETKFPIHHRKEQNRSGKTSSEFLCLEDCREVFCLALKRRSALRARLTGLRPGGPWPLRAAPRLGSSSAPLRLGPVPLRQHHPRGQLARTSAARTPG